VIRLAFILLWCANVVCAQSFSGLARIDVDQSAVVLDGEELVVDVQLDQTVPYRVILLNDPMRAVLEFREIDWSGVAADAFAQDGSVQFGNTHDGWSRVAIELEEPMIVSEAGMVVDEASGAARVTVRLAPVSADVFALRAQKPAQQPLRPTPRPGDDGPLVIVIDPGHGGLDPGAQRGGANEADLMLRLGVEVAEGLARAGFRAVLTRESDFFVPLADRMSLARSSGADLLISLHADALTLDEARGASVYTLTEKAVDEASARMAERHERGDLLAGVLVEVGFLSSARDREMLSSSQGRAPIVAGLVDAVQRWAIDEAARAPLVRQ